MTRSDWSTADELGWREAARWWFLMHGVAANLAEDLTQEALLRLLRVQQRGQPLTRAYLHRVCQSVLYDHLRQCAREPSCQPLDACCCVAVAESGFQQAEDRVFLEQALGQLRPLERAIVEMHHLEEQTFETIAATLGIPVERAKKISQRAIKKMQQWARSSGVGGGDLPNHLSLTQSAKRFILWRSLDGEWTSRRAFPSSAVLETARCTFSADCHRGSVVRRASIRRVHIWEEAAADRSVCGFGQSQAESGNLSSRVGVQPIAEGCGDRGDAIVRLHGCRASLSGDTAFERFSCGGAGQHLGTAVGVSRKCGRSDCFI